nr:DNA topoisomerase [Alphaproteobacteria bacterium]
QNSKNQLFQARLTKLASKKLEKFAIPNADEAEKTVQKLRKLSGWHVIDLENKPVRRNPAPPFITSTLQQEASRKLGFSATQTMRLAQKLYEGIEIDGETVGLISYMRTDSVQLSIESMNSCRNIIGQDFGKDYVPEKPRFYKSSAKNAQEAHEAIRPTDIYRKPISLARFLSKPELQLYEIIWKRTVASQMSSAILEQISADISDRDYQAVLHATGSVLKFKGFLAVYQESQDDLNDPDQENAILPPLQIKEQVGLNGLSKTLYPTTTTL